MINRRYFLQLTAGGTLAAMSRPRLALGQDPVDEHHLVPADKGLAEEWVRSLTARGEPEVNRGEELRYIGMPVGGVCAGLLYLGGDGKLWLWDIFNRNSMARKVTYQGRTFGNSDGATYVEPLVPESPLVQNFAVSFKSDKEPRMLTLDRNGGWEEITFEGAYPIGTVDYRADALAVKLEAFSPFIPLNVEDSSLPATVLRYTVTNTGSMPAEVELAGWLENVILSMSSPHSATVRKIEALDDGHGQGVLLTASLAEPPPAPARADIPFADFSDGTYDGWVTSGEAFGTAPVARRDLPVYMNDAGGTGAYLVTSHNFRAATSAKAADDFTGTLTSPEFVIERKFIRFMSSGGHRPGETGVRLLVGGKPVLEQTGENRNRLAERFWDVETYAGQHARIEIFDQAKGAWGNVHAADFAFTDHGPAQVPVKKRHDYGTMALYLVNAGKGVACTEEIHADTGSRKASFPANAVMSNEGPVGAVKAAFTLAPGESQTRSFVIAWHFPNVDPAVNGVDMVHSYAVRFSDAGAVARYVGENFARLSGETATWVETWRDSTLPHWFLRRTFQNICNLATTTSYRFASGQFWAWEGVYSCSGTCTHVWGYAQAMSRIFPELERALREKTDYAFALNPRDGTIQFRGTHDGFAADGQAGIILRTYREHLMTLDDTFLKPLWPRVKLAMDRLIRQVNDKGLLDGPQHNTLDTAWYGEVAWLSGLYLAALRAAEEMAKVCGDGEYAGRVRALFDKGAAAITPELFNGEYFYNKVDPKHLDAINSGTGCEIDQVMGQSWAWQVGLGRIFPRAETVTALKSLYRYNFAPDAGLYHEKMKVGRWYAMPGEAGLLICTFPRPDWDFKRASGKGPEWAALYFNECQSGYEHEAASHMIAEGLVREGLAVTRAIHDRYGAAKRNPFNEIECGDHYSRAMASYASFISMCGFEYRGPERYIAFAPRLTPESFKAPFTSAKGWGTFAQEVKGGELRASLAVKWGELEVRTCGLTPPEALKPTKARVTLGEKEIEATVSEREGRWEVAFAQVQTVNAGQTLAIVLS